MSIIYMWVESEVTSIIYIFLESSDIQCFVWAFDLIMSPFTVNVGFINLGAPTNIDGFIPLLLILLHPDEPFGQYIVSTPGKLCVFTGGGTLSRDQLVRNR